MTHLTNYLRTHWGKPISLTNNNIPEQSQWPSVEPHFIGQFANGHKYMKRLPNDVTIRFDTTSFWTEVRNTLTKQNNSFHGRPKNNIKYKDGNEHMSGDRFATGIGNENDTWTELGLGLTWGFEWTYVLIRQWKRRWLIIWNWG